MTTDLPRKPAGTGGRAGTILAACLGPVAAVAAVMIAGPFYDTPFNDDFSYLWTARKLAEEGRFLYNGFANAMVGVQAIWAAAVIKLFGFSPTTVRLGTLPFAAGCGWMAYALGRRSGLPPGLACFGSLTLVLCPVFIPLADSFMTDVTGLFFQLAAIYACTRMVEAESEGGSMAWLLTAVVLGVAGGTVRQIVWLVPLFLVPVAGWMVRRRTRVLIATALAWAAGVGAIAGVTAWHRAQPYLVPESFPSLETLKQSRAAIDPLFRLLLMVVLMSLPSVIGTLTAWGPASKRRSPAVVALFVGLATLGPILALRGAALPPWLSDLGYVDWPLVGDRPLLFTVPVRLALGLASIAPMAYILLGIARSADERVEAARQEGASPWRSIGAGLRPYFPPAVLFLLLFDALLIPLLLRRAVVGMIFERYGLPLMLPIPLILLIRQHRAGRGGVGAAGWACLLIFAAFGIAETHDRIGQLQAQKAMLARMVDSGIPRSEILAGFELDGWYQIEVGGYINDPEMKNPPGAYRPTDPGLRIPELAHINYYGHSDHFPAIRPHYFVASSPRDPLVPVEVPPVRYRCWLPPFEREVLGLRWQGGRGDRATPGRKAAPADDKVAPAS